MNQTTSIRLARVLYIEYTGHGSYGSGGWSRRAKHRPLPVLHQFDGAVEISGASILFDGRRKLKAVVFDMAPEIPQLIRADKAIDDLFTVNAAANVPRHFRDIAGRDRYYFKGVELPTLTPDVEQIKAEQNAERRRLLIELFGGAVKFAEAGGMIAVHVDDFGTLYRDGSTAVVKVICPSTGREYFLAVDPSRYKGRAGTEARAAVASTWRKPDGKLAFKTPEAYQPQIQA